MTMRGIRIVEESIETIIKELPFMEGFDFEPYMGEILVKKPKGKYNVVLMDQEVFDANYIFEEDESTTRFSKVDEVLSGRIVRHPIGNSQRAYYSERAFQ